MSKYILFEEPINKKGYEKTYDLDIGVYDTLEEVEKYAEFYFDRTKEDLFVADYENYINGNYDYIRKYVHN